MASMHSTEPATLLWPVASVPNSIASGEVHLWGWTFDRSASPAEADLRILNEFERGRTARFRFSPDQVRYSVSHANMRRILGSYLGQTPEELTFFEGPGGKPELDGVPAPLRFNLSHSKTLGVLAVALDLKVGVDVEDIRPIEADVAKRFFSAREYASLSTLCDQPWLDAFYRCWTRKEAIIKAEGLGLRMPLDSFDVSLLENEPAALLDARPKAKLTAHWTLHHLSVAVGSMGALAVDQVPSEIITRAFPSEVR